MPSPQIGYSGTEAFARVHSTSFVVFFPSFIDIGNITSLYDDLFLCKSGDEILSIDNRCDGSVNDCSDGSDEDDCDQCELLLTF